MAPYNDDFFGGMFDFNGNGRTDPEEKVMAYRLFEGDTKEDGPGSGNSNNSGKRATGYRQPARHANSSPSTQTIPEHLSLADYKKRRREFIGNTVFTILFTALFCIVPLAIMGVGICFFDTSSLIVFFSMLFVLGGLLILGLFIGVAASLISEEYKHLMKAKEVYLKDAQAEEPNRQTEEKK